MWLIIFFQVLIIVLLSVYINDLVVIEKFTAGYGTTFGHYFHPVPPCTNETNCFNTLTPHKAFQTTQNQTITTHFHMPIAKPLTKNFTM